MDPPVDPKPDPKFDGVVRYYFSDKDCKEESEKVPMVKIDVDNNCEDLSATQGMPPVEGEPHFLTVTCKEEDLMMFLCDSDTCDSGSCNVNNNIKYFTSDYTHQFGLLWPNPIV